jgi:molybdopterin converting factor small subunit
MDMAVESSQTIRRIEVKFLGLTRIETGTTKDYVELPESATIRDVIRVLTEKYGSRFDDVGGIDSSISNVQVISFVSMVPLAGG